jgi:hypothetical protein
MLPRRSLARAAAHQHDREKTMSNTAKILDDVRAQLAPDDKALDLAKERRDAVRAAAKSFRGGDRTFASGSLAHATANCPVHQRDKGLDADSGVVLDRQIWPDLGPDAAMNVGPTGVVKELRDHLDRKITVKYPKAKSKITKRAILYSFNAPLPSGEDPTVDLVVGLDRVGRPGLWIPNTELDRWDPSHPEKHTQLLTADPKELRVVRARAIRLAKAENKKTASPPLCSFNIEALGLMFVQPGMTVVEALHAIWREGAQDLARRPTPDPAGVSGDIKVADRRVAMDRLNAAADILEEALKADQDEWWVRRHLARLWPEFVSTRPGESTRARLAAATRARQHVGVTGAGVLSTTAGATLKRPNSFGAR